MTVMPDVCFSFLDVVGYMFALFLFVLQLIVFVLAVIGETSNKHVG